MNLLGRITAIAILLFSFCDINFAQEQSAAHNLLVHIASLQNKEGINRGLFPSFREYHYRRGTYKKDENIFFTALILWTLRNQLTFLAEADRILADSIIKRAYPSYAFFQNAKGRPTYNFWRTKPPEIFPNGGWLNIFNKAQALPDDLDDTAIVMLAMDADSSTAAGVQRIMQHFANDGTRAKAALSGYRQLHAYSTWFGKKMPVDMDACVLSNILLMCTHYRLPFQKADSASLDFLVKVVENRDYLKNGALVSPHYQRPAVILYHLSRLMAGGNFAALNKHQPQLVADAMKLYNRSTNVLDKILLSTALLRWHQVPPHATVKLQHSLSRELTRSPFVFFVANMASMFKYPFNKWLGRLGIGRFNYYCPAYNYALVLENMLL